MIVVAGHLMVVPARREAFVEESSAAVAQARQAAGCRDFSVSPDPLEDGRVNILEVWDSVEALEAFRQDGPPDSLADVILEARIEQYDVPDPAAS